MTGDRIEIHVYRGDEAIIMSDILPEVAKQSKGLLASMAWLEPAFISLLWKVAHQLTDETTVHEEGNG